MEIKETYSVPSLTYKMELFCKDNENENYYKSIDDVVKCLKEKVMLYVNEETIKCQLISAVRTGRVSWPGNEDSFLSLNNHNSQDRMGRGNPILTFLCHFHPLNKTETLAE